MRILFSSTSGWGHVHPMLPLATTLRDRGHDVVFATAEDARVPVEAAGLTVSRPAGSVLAERMDRCIELRPDLLTMPGSEKPLVMFPVLFGGASATPMFDDLLPFATEWRADVILHDPAELAAPIVAAALGIPSAVHSLGSRHPGVDPRGCGCVHRAVVGARRARAPPARRRLRPPLRRPLPAEHAAHCGRRVPRAYRRGRRCDRSPLPRAATSSPLSSRRRSPVGDRSCTRRSALCSTSTRRSLSVVAAARRSGRRRGGGHGRPQRGPGRVW